MLDTPIFLFRGCPRCTGTVVNSSDQFGPDVYCLQCGHRMMVEVRGKDFRKAYSKKVINGVRV